MRIVWTTRARLELADKAAWIAKDRPRAAVNWLASVEEAVGQLPAFPMRGRHLPEFPDDPARELVLPPYRVLYVPSERKLTVVSVKHSREEIREHHLRPDD